MIKTRYWVIGIAAVLVISVIAVLLMQRDGSADMTAEIYLDSECIKTIDLSEVYEPYSFTVEGQYGKNVISVERGKIRVSDADCPDRVCVNQGWQSTGELPIVCLPHRMVIKLVPNNPDDADDVDGVIQ
ncbi:MAG: NusG domain II-containing protein [Eubacteriales bacterium]